MVNMEVSNISDMDAVVTLGKDIAMQIAAMRPLYLDTNSVDPEELEKEKEIQLVKAIEENKAKNLPDDKVRAIAENMVKGRINKFYEDICLLNQPYVRRTSSLSGSMSIRWPRLSAAPSRSWHSRALKRARYREEAGKLRGRDF